ncbi:hypothetical protein [Kitasatospora albolonga]|uniref:hypothetical protein n=1 Tax=Kitasatospora albolonga TaxID=68173 RepID=UPI003CD07AA6
MTLDHRGGVLRGVEGGAAGCRVEGRDDLGELRQKPVADRVHGGREGADGGGGEDAVGQQRTGQAVGPAQSVEGGELSGTRNVAAALAG